MVLNSNEQIPQYTVIIQGTDIYVYSTRRQKRAETISVKELSLQLHQHLIFIHYI